MAKLQEEVLVVKVSKLLKESEVAQPMIDGEAITSLEAIVQELAGAGVLVEIESA
jgi:hypothetical protein